MRTKTKLKAKFAGGKPEIEIRIDAEGNVSEVECNVDLSKTETIYELEKRTEQRIQGYVEAAARKAQNGFKSDILGFGEAMHRDQPKSWKAIKNDWGQIFTHASIQPKIDVKLRRTGKIGKSFIQEIKSE
jgi:spore germination protein KC